MGNHSELWGIKDFTLYFKVSFENNGIPLFIHLILKFERILLFLEKKKGVFLMSLSQLWLC